MIHQISNRIRSSKQLFKRFKYSLPDLPYDYNALEPVISAEIMQLHHQKHHAAYVNNLNVALEKLDRAISNHDLSTQISLQSAIKFNGGGNLNHSIFWKNLSPPSKASGHPSGSLAAAIDKVFGSFDSLKALFKAQTAAVQGSGWGWLGYNPITRSIQFATTFNQDPLQATHGLIPLMGVDVWEHAYYLQYKNARPDYLDAIWKVINWDEVAVRFMEAESGPK